MKVFAKTDSDTRKFELTYLHKLLKEWLQAEWDNYNYDAKGIAMVAENIAVFLETPDEFAKLEFSDVEFGSEDGILKLEFDNDGEVFHFGFLTASKIKNMPEEPEFPISLTNDEDTVHQLKTRQGVKVTPLKCDDMDEFLATIKDNKK